MGGAGELTHDVAEEPILGNVVAPMLFGGGGGLYCCFVGSLLAVFVCIDNKIKTPLILLTAGCIENKVST